MRAHLPGCVACKAHYQRHLTLAALDPGALAARERIARGLGLRVRERRLGGWRAWLAAGVLVPAAVGLLLLVSRPDQPTVGEMAARGRATSLEERSALWIYRVPPGEGPRLVERGIRGDDELAFAYANPAARPFLLIFGVDEHRHVYWFHPAWPMGGAAPGAIRALPGLGPHELSEAIRHRLDGRQLTVVAVFSDRRLDATTLEDAVRSAPAGDAMPLGLLGAGVSVVERKLEVLP